MTCFKCNKKGHTANQCPDSPPTCWNCNKPGHTARDCRAPKVEAAVNAGRAQQPTARERVYTTDGAETEAADGLICSSCEIAGNSLIVLFDSGATHSFIDIACATKLKPTMSKLPFDLIVSIHASKSLITNIACLECP
ncbi:zinc finger protein GIS2-like [Lotus japonicus]|uniref:zinc finger protein GIS2-like n=1 Tax=Lotus japonicus TaxID=34305 RepID=UPI00258B269F|nr:zinc finger protein GIS2-like [Lotus japonicus]